MSLNAGASAFVPGQGFKLQPRVTEAPKEQQTYVLQPRVTEAPGAKPATVISVGGQAKVSTPPQTKVEQPKETPKAEPAKPKQPEIKKPEPVKAVEQPKETPKPAPATQTEDWEAVENAPEKAETKKPTKVAQQPQEENLDDGADDFDSDDEKKETHKEKKKRLEAEAEDLLVANDDPREHLNVVFIGHVDSGKSTTSGQILYLTGMVDQRTIEKYGKEASDKNRGSWFLAYIMDTNEEERAKGKTVEVGRAHFFTEKKRYTILDAPGHKAYVPNMMAGLAQADIGVLVISARKGEFEAGFDRSGQTREHAILAKTLGIKKLIVFINKMDDPTVMWDKARYDDIKDKLEKFLKSLAFNMKTDVVFVGGAGLSGANVKELVSADVCPWYTGLSLLDTFDSLKPLDRMEDLPLRIPVLDKYKESGKTYILGKVETGCLKTGDEIISNPGQVRLEVFRIENDSNIITIAKPGENVKIIVKCTQIEEDQLIRGSVMSHPSSLCPVTDQIVGQISVLQLLETKTLFTAGYGCVFHTGTAQEECTVVRLLDLLDPKTGQSIQKLPTFVKEKAVAVAHFQLAKPMCLEKLTEFPQLGRFTLRDEGKTIGFGKVLATQAPMKVKKAGR